MTGLRTAAQQALEALQELNGWQSLAPPEASRAAVQAAINLSAALAEPVQQGCEHCNSPLYAAIKCRVCGRETEPSHQPVAWIHTDPDNPRVKFLEWREDEPGYRGRWIKTPLYTSPQR